MSSSIHGCRARATAVLGVAALLALAGCGVAGQSSGESVDSVDSGTAAVAPALPGQGVGGADAAQGPSAELNRVDAADSAPAGGPIGKQVIRSAAAVLGVEDLTASRASLLSIVSAAGGTVVNEYVYAGPDQQPYPQPMMGGMTAEQAYPYYGYDQFVDMTFTVPAAQYEATMAKVRGLGNVLSVQLTSQDVTGTVVDIDARIRAARASVTRVEALLGKAKNLQEFLLLEQELTTRQANLDSLVSQQQALAGQVADSTIGVRMVPQALVDQAGGSPYADPTLWDRMLDAFVKAWSGFAIAVAILSPVLVLGLIVAVVVVLVLRRRRHSRAAAAPAAEPQGSAGES